METVQEVGVKKEKGFLYFVDKQGDVGRARMARSGQPKGKAEKVASAGVKKEPGYLYFITKTGDIGRSKMQRGRSP